MRAFRPSRFAPVEENEEDRHPVKEANMEVYARRAEAGMPLFDGPPLLPDASVRSSTFLTGK